MGTITRPQYGKFTSVGITLQVKPITSEQFEDLRQHMNAYHGNLTAIPSRVGWQVTIRNDNGELEHQASAGYERIQEKLYIRAFENGWVDTDRGVFVIDLAQFDPWDIGYCVQMAAFGTYIVG